ncbi:hypothetical protein V6N13_034020 [Hibiscus sabdariffa]
MDEVPIDDGRLSEFDVINLPHDPGKRRKVSDFHPDDRDIVRRKYIQKQPCQPRGGDAFVGSGFRAWNRTDAFVKHVGGHMSAHNQALGRLNDFKNQKTSISSGFSRQSDESTSAYRLRDVYWLFGDVLAPLLNFVGGSPKRKEFLREKQAEHVVEALSLGQLESGIGLNQEIVLSRLGDTRWGSHFKTILNVLLLLPKNTMHNSSLVPMSRGGFVIVQDIGSVSSPNLSPSNASLQASSPSNNGSSDELGETQDIPQNQDKKHVEATSVHMDEVPIDDGRLSEFDVINLPHDPGKRRKISDFHPDDRDIVRRKYIQKQPCQPSNHEFPKTDISGKNRRFNPNLFQKHESWLEYSVEKDAVFCFVCYLFKDDNTGGGDAFVGSGFRAWNRTDAFVKHVGGHMSAHNQALGRLNDFKNQKTSISSGFSRQSDESTSAYRLRSAPTDVPGAMSLLQRWTDMAEHKTRGK